ncbi:MAG: hypothetical protein M3N13_05975 [Candidatus Eremiobacteraeota bacterium]|nr:hypothetical protein [Candidatus Eremiobacteraeota bacterium]
MLLAGVGCGDRADSVVLAFPHGGNAGAQGIRASEAAEKALHDAGLRTIVLDLDPGVTNPHEDEGTDDERAVEAASRLPGRIPPGVRAVIVGPTRAIADAVPWRRIMTPVIGVAPLVRDMPCVCPSESQLLRAEPRLAVEAADGSNWTRGARRYRTLAEAVRPLTSGFEFANRLGDRYRVSVKSRGRVLANTAGLDLRTFSSQEYGVEPIGDTLSLEAQVLHAVRVLVVKGVQTRG